MVLVPLRPELARPHLHTNIVTSSHLTIVTVTTLTIVTNVTILTIVTILTCIPRMPAACAPPTSDTMSSPTMTTLSALRPREERPARKNVPSGFPQICSETNSDLKPSS